MNKPDLPDPNDWQPRISAAETLQSAFLQRCLATERLIGLRAQAEREMNIDNYDSGAGIEDIVREELRKILPSRYTTGCGLLVDREGRTSGDHDVIIFNEHWFPNVKASATPSSRRKYYPIEGAYAVGELKQTLDYSSLDSALQKLVTAHRLTRRPTFAKRLVENRESSSCAHGLSNPLYSFVMGVNLGKGVSFEELINRFYDINRKVKRLEVVRALCVLGHGTVIWGFRDREKGGITPGLFMLGDLYEPLVPMYFAVKDIQSALFGLLGNLMLHLFHSVLAPEDIAAIYGLSNNIVKAPTSSEIILPPDPGSLESLSIPCGHKHRSEADNSI